ncbi:hypothetical protein K491DRAFT_782541 [Lophiostoma macrostomum CBS 122681]|uniref:Uncharacterized protein n=1 Tax=Lophiostoma macrostomum CBS 122681 TaxID=1314788 RepID=A0A6A6SS04_9PLEO|nr:hypothetical protein K491DRAFT_782541 [Lophiostoma macrostomum CBS 122681]
MDMEIGPYFEEWREREKTILKVHGLQALRCEPYAGSQFLLKRGATKNLYNAWKSDQDRNSQDKRHGSHGKKQAHDSEHDTQSATAKATALLASTVIQSEGASSIEKLPLEIHLMICKDEVLSEDDLYYLCYLRVFNSAATQILYNRCNCDLRGTALLLRTLLEKPALGEHVRVLEINGGFTNDKGVTASKTKEVLTILALRSGNLQAHKNLMGLADETKVEFMAGLLTFLVPNLQNLSFPTIYSGEHPLLALVATAQEDPAMLLPSTATLGALGILTFATLKKIQLESGSSPNVSKLSPLFKLPALNTLIAKGFKESREPAQWTCDPSAFGSEQGSNISSLELHGNGTDKVNIDVLISMLKACKSLKALTLDKITPAEVVQGGKLRLALPRLKEALNRFKDSLVFLNLYGMGVKKRLRWRPFGSFAEYTHQCLRVDAYVFFRPRQTIEHFPLMSALLSAGIEELHLGRVTDVGNLDEALQFGDDGLFENLAENPDILPKLKAIYVHALDSWENYKMWAGMEMGSERSGLERPIQVFMYRKMGDMGTGAFDFVKYSCVE